MNTLQYKLHQRSVFQVVKHRIQRVISRVFWGAAFALICNGTALALEINQANEAELDSVKGMGPSLSAKVLQARAHGPFKDWPDLMRRVAGIRQNKAQQFSEQGLTVNGQAFVTKP
jgi:competence protein ComEA